MVSQLALASFFHQAYDHMLKYFFNYLVTLILVFPGLAIAQPGIQQFKQEIFYHRQRVLENGVLIALNFSHRLLALKTLNLQDREALVRFYLAMHDAPKSMNLKELRDIGYQGPRAIYRDLHRIYGQDVQGQQPDYILELNRVEEIMKLEKLRTYLKDFSNEQFKATLKDLQWIEKISDFTDTKIYRGAELGFKPKRYSTEDYFMDQKDFEAAKISHWLERAHHTPLTCNALFL